MRAFCWSARMVYFMIWSQLLQEVTGPLWGVKSKLQETFTIECTIFGNDIFQGLGELEKLLPAQDCSIHIFFHILQGIGELEKLIAHATHVCSIHHTANHATPVTLWKVQLLEQCKFYYSVLCSCGGWKPVVDACATPINHQRS
jgi:hypothetical protein